ncbi:GreA/GreB family elongation factor [Candidatus Uhrbacteria bacterium]|nr:GreA/GreB family elongation factor [Candidatus Uhrbacteria bacterium]
MRLPIRKSEQLASTKVVDDQYLTPEAIERMKRTMKRLIDVDRGEAVAEVRRTGENGDFSENEEYQAAKWKLRGINNHILVLEDKIKRAIPIQQGSNDGKIRLGSVVRVSTGATGGKESVWHIVGAQEANPVRGKLSHLSPIGQALLGHREGEEVTVQVNGREMVFGIKEVR